MTRQNDVWCYLFSAFCAVNCQRFQQEPLGFFGVRVSYQKIELHKDWKMQ